MATTDLYLGAVPNDGTGTDLRAGGQIINDNFAIVEADITTVQGNLTTHEADTANPHSVTKTQVGLSNVDNTSDINKPISTATQAEIDTKQDTLVSGTNIKTINGATVLGSGDIVVGDAVDSVNGKTGVVVLDAGDIAEVTDKNYVTDAEAVAIGNTSGINTGDETEAGILTKLGVTQVLEDVIAGTNITIDKTDVNNPIINSTATGGSVSNFYNTYKLPQLFNPDAGQVTADTGDFTLSGSSEVGIVTINGQTLDDSEYSLSGTTITITPDNGFYTTADEILVFQTKVTATGLDTGWGYYQDSTYTSGSPLVVNNTRQQVSIDGAGPNTETTYLPDSGELWDTTADELTLNAVGDSFLFRLDFKAKATTNNAYFDAILNIGSGSNIDIIRKTLTIRKGINAEQWFSETMLGFSLSTFISNGGELEFDTTDDGANISFYDIAIVPYKLP